MSEKKERPLPKSLLVVWILVSFFAPFAVFYYTITGGMASIGSNIIYALLWAYIPYPANNDLAGPTLFGIRFPIDDLGNTLAGFHFFNPLILMWIPVFGFFTIVFAAQVIRYIQDKSSFTKTIIAGALTMAIPLYQTFSFLPNLLGIGPYFIGPIPIQLIAGILIARKYSPKQLDKPWDDYTESPELGDSKPPSV